MSLLRLRSRSATIVCWALLTVPGCGSSHVVSPDGTQVEVMENTIPVGAEDLGQVSVVSGAGCGASGTAGSREEALELLRTEVAKRHADVVQLQSVAAGEGAHCNEWRAVGVAFNSKPRTKAVIADTNAGGLAVRGTLPPTQLEHVKAPEHEPESAITTSGSTSLPAPEGPPPYRLGFERPVEGCLQGQVYRVDQQTPSLDTAYAARAPQSRLWGCEWQMSDAPLEQAVPHAKPGQTYVVRYQGTFNAPADGVFKFDVSTSSQMRVVIDGGVVTEDTSATSATGATSTGEAATEAAKVRRSDSAVFLGEGKHQIGIEFLVSGSSLSLQIGVTAPGSTTSSALSMRPTSPLYSAQGLDYTGSARAPHEGGRKLVSATDTQLTLNGRIFFATDSADINQEEKSEATLLAVAQALRDHPALSCIEVQGHTDDTGDVSHNLELSRARAAAVRQWLVAAGIEPHRLAHRGFGGSQPLASNTNEDGRTQNRRVQFSKKSLGPGGTCEGAGSERIVRNRHADPSRVSAACSKGKQVRTQLASELASWLTNHRQCQVDADCVQAVPLECPSKRRALGCGWVLVSESSVESLRLHSARLDSVHGFCEALPEDDLVRSCGGCTQRTPSCAAGLCQL